MITSVQIKNFKSVVDLTLDLGTFNVLIGENGCGKSNILEAIAFGGAASADKLDYEFLGSRGIRLTNAEFVVSAFDKSNQNKEIELIFNSDESFVKQHHFRLLADPINPKKWKDSSKEIFDETFKTLLEKLVFEENDQIRNAIIKNITANFEEDIITKPINDLRENLDSYNLDSLGFSDKFQLFKIILNLFEQEKFSNKSLSNFIIYTPEQSSLRKFEETNQIYPLGVKGEGLFQYLKEVSTDKEKKKILLPIKKALQFIDWYEDLSVPKKTISSEFNLKIKDKYLNEGLKYFDQRSTNEGFLFLLFYSTLFISKDTPFFFAIDNIDTAFNPKFCIQLIKTLIQLAKKHGKQVIVTTHNPAILDGLDLQDESQRLFVVRRNDEGHTRIKRIDYKPSRTMRLSELWTKGIIGGLPDNF